ncbi:hypothetical protein M9H77_13643 [Catharanthus roseus]|uniref:Uncharacterized protein n=1 Tax=Catharanthus roseus TaxID=4058 RepID=A0ACC0BKR3_CATRO|nr:hypothetical protein M9H77_13643 [Catharanthus roseus]
MHRRHLQLILSPLIVIFFRASFTATAIVAMYTHLQLSFTLPVPTAHRCHLQLRLFPLTAIFFSSSSTATAAVAVYFKNLTCFYFGFIYFAALSAVCFATLPCHLGFYSSIFSDNSLD